MIVTFSVENNSNFRSYLSCYIDLQIYMGITGPDLVPTLNFRIEFACNMISFHHRFSSLVESAI